MFEDETIAEEVDTGQGSRRNGNVQTHASGSHVTNRKLTGEQEPLLGSGSGVGTEPVDEDGDGEGSDSEWKGVPWWKQPSVIWLLPVCCLFMMAFGAVAVPRLNIILELLCKDYLADRQLSDDPLRSDDGKTCQEIPEVQQLASQFTLYMNLISGALSAITSPWLGTFSDRHGRRIVLALASLGLFASEVTTILAAKYPQHFSVNLILVGAVVDGVSGSFLLGMSMAHAYAADTTNIAKRAVNFGYFQGALFLGIALGPGLGGYIIERTGNVLLVFYLAMASHGFFVLYVLAVLPESLTAERMERAREKYERIQLANREELERLPKTWFQRARSWNPFEPLGILWPTGPGSSPRVRTNLALLAATDTLLFGVTMGGMVLIMYAEFKFGWHNYESSVFISKVNSTRVALLFFVIPLVVHLVRSKKKNIGSGGQERHVGADTLDIILIRLSIVVEFLGSLMYAFAQTGGQFTVAGMFTALGGVISPTLQSSMTKHIPSDRIGQLLGATTLLHSVARVIAPAIFNIIYLATVKTFPQAVFVCLASVFFVAFVCSWFITPHVYLHEDGDGNIVDGEYVEGGGERGGD